MEEDDLKQSFLSSHYKAFGLISIVKLGSSKFQLLFLKAHYDKK